MSTGLNSIGQRELIIGDRQVGIRGVSAGALCAAVRCTERSQIERGFPNSKFTSTTLTSARYSLSNSNTRRVHLYRRPRVGLWAAAWRDSIPLGNCPLFIPSPRPRELCTSFTGAGIRPLTHVPLPRHSTNELPPPVPFPPTPPRPLLSRLQPRRTPGTVLQASGSCGRGCFQPIPNPTRPSRCRRPSPARSPSQEYRLLPDNELPDIITPLLSCTQPPSTLRQPLISAFAITPTVQ